LIGVILCLDARAAELAAGRKNNAAENNMRLSHTKYPAKGGFTMRP